MIQADIIDIYLDARRRTGGKLIHYAHDFPGVEGEVVLNNITFDGDKLGGVINFNYKGEVTGVSFGTFHITDKKAMVKDLPRLINLVSAAITEGDIDLSHPYPTSKYPWPADPRNRPTLNS